MPNICNKNYFFIKMVLERCTLRFAKLTENAFSPTKGSAFAAGFDLKRYTGLVNSYFLQINTSIISVLMNTKYQPVENKLFSLIFKLNYRLDVMVELHHGLVWLQRISSTLVLV